MLGQVFSACDDLWVIRYSNMSNMRNEHVMVVVVTLEGLSVDICRGLVELSHCCDMKGKLFWSDRVD